MKRSRISIIVMNGLLIGLIAILLITQQKVEASPEVNLTSKELLWVPDERIPHMLALGDDGTAADMLWIRSVFYLVEQGFHDKYHEYLESKGLGEWHDHHGNEAHDDEELTDEVGQHPNDGPDHSVEESAQENPYLHSEVACSDPVHHVDHAQEAQSFADIKFSQVESVRNALYWNFDSEDAIHFEHLLDVITNLDSLYLTPYVQGSLNLAMLAGRYDEALEMLAKGARNKPERWEMPYYRGFINLFYQDDKVAAAASLQEAALKPDAPVIVVQLAAALQAGLGKKRDGVGVLAGHLRNH